jgi:hypothetical protein
VIIELLFGAWLNAENLNRLNLIQAEVGRAFEELGVVLIVVNSPGANGRCGELFRTRRVVSYGGADAKPRLKVNQCRSAFYRSSIEYFPN